MLFSLFSFFLNISADQNVNCKFETKLSKCSKDCIGFDRSNLKDFSIVKNDIQVTLENEKGNPSKIICKNCYFSARLINKLKENKKFYETTIQNKGNSINLLRDSELGYCGIKTNSFYFLISPMAGKTVFEKYKLLRLKIDDSNGVFSMTGESFDLPYDLEEGNIVYFGSLKDEFLLYDISGESYQEVKISIKNVKNYLKNLLYVFSFMGIVWIGSTVFKMRKQIVLKLSQKKDAISVKKEIK